jgi:hypothetical protein
MSFDWDIRDQGSGSLTEDKSGFSQARRWKIRARSEIQARTAIRLLAGVFVGAPWYTTYGERPDASVVCRSLKIDGQPHAPFGGVGDYLVEAQYSPAEREEAVIGGPAVYRLQPSLVSTPIDLDADGDAITNIVGEPVDPALSDFEDQEVLSVEWWRKFDDLAACFAAIRPFRNALNLVSWQGLAKGSARCHGVLNGEEVEVAEGVGTKLWVKLSTKIEVREPITIADLSVDVIDKDGNALTGTLEGWSKLYANRGRRTLGAVVDGVQQYEPILTEDGADVVSEPVPLAADGTRLGSAAAQVAIARDVVRKYLDFADLGI